LQAHDVGPGSAQPLEQIGKAPLDVVDIEARDLHELPSMEATLDGIATGSKAPSWCPCAPSGTTKALLQRRDSDRNQKENNETECQNVNQLSFPSQALSFQP